MNAVAVVPARGGSKRIPRKNVRVLGGRPLLAYTVDAALESGLFERVVVSTDDDAIAAVAEQLGAVVPFMRPAAFADDHTPASRVTLDVVERLKLKDGQHVAQLLPNCPLRTAADVRASYQQFVVSESEAQISVHAVRLAQPLVGLGDGRPPPDPGICRAAQGAQPRPAHALLPDGRGLVDHGGYAAAGGNVLHAAADGLGTSLAARGGHRRRVRLAASRGLAAGERVKTALYTTVHPASAPYLEAFFSSVGRQTDAAFDLWIGLDQLKPEALETVLVPFADVRFVVADRGDTPASLRRRAWEEVAARYDVLIMVDSDDVLYPERVAAAKMQLRDYDVCGCALSLIAEDGSPLGLDFQSPHSDWTELLPRCNVFGLSNTAYRCDVLAKTLPIPADVSLVDWFLVTHAFFAGAALSFDATPRMAYRQYGENTARVLAPFTPQYVAKATRHVLEHSEHVLGPPTGAAPATFEARFGEVQRFADALGDGVLERYTRALNARTQPVYRWWECVAHEELKDLWKS